ncbi:MAG TPA: NAD(P)/FAD-dependent oxidoreductase [Myxococcota bacterium]|nr:NAD(P)/FAD-dependent oxidoreductase [Myxococcota bacterium]
MGEVAGEVGVAVIGAGVVGLACAAALAAAGREVLVLERHGRIAHETTSRNSGVIHAGLYYPTGSLKAQLCVEGRERLYARCAAQGIPHKRTGKLVVASAEHEEPALESLRVRGSANGVAGLRLIDAREIRALEPRVAARAALLVPVTGIVDPEQLAASYQAELESRGGRVLLHGEVSALERKPDGWRIFVNGPGGARESLRAAAVVNAAGLSADRMAGLAGVDVDAARYRQHPCKGDYFSIAPSAGHWADRLIYPVPHGPGLGVHLTVDLGGRYRLGPDAHYVDRIHYDVDPAKGPAFAEMARRFLPELDAAQIAPDYAGMRPKLAGPGEDFRDFVIAEESARGLPGLVNLVGIESPGLTSAGAIAARVARLI